MKKIPLLFSFLLIAFFSQAQIDKGTILLGGDISLSTYSAHSSSGAPPKYQENVFYVDPSIGLAVRNNFVLGLDLGLGYESRPVENGYKDNNYQAGVFLRQYKFLGSGSCFFGATELAFGYNDLTQDQSVGYRQDERTTSAELSFAPGVAYALNHRWQLEVVFPQVLDLTYSHQKMVFNIPDQGGGAQNE
ncbi:MAG TPA: hypothetical protein VN616_17255 [Puia sp.]|nr:hypothetical protein [Puia sp.]